MLPKDADRIANSVHVYSDQTAPLSRSTLFLQEQSVLSLHCLPRSLFSNI